MDIVLASVSPRRKELIKYIYPEFISIDPEVDESVPESVEHEEGPEYIAVRKALKVSKTNKQNLVIACDTAVLIDDKVLGKPADEEDARRMLNLLSGRTHLVITGCCICLEGQQMSFSQKTNVSFYSLTDDEIDEYIQTREPFDKAGAYGIQGAGAVHIKGIEGDYYNVMGFPIAKIKRMIAIFLDMNNSIKESSI